MARILSGRPKPAWAFRTVPVFCIRMTKEPEPGKSFFVADQVSGEFFTRSISQQSSQMMFPSSSFLSTMMWG